MDLPPCPGCRQPIGLDVEVCPVCRRPRDAAEIEDGRRYVADLKARRRRRPYVLAARLLAVVVLILAFRARAPVTRALNGLLLQVRADETPPAPAPAPPPAPVVPAEGAPGPLLIIDSPPNAPAPVPDAFRAAPATPAYPAPPPVPPKPLPPKAGPAPDPGPPGAAQYTRYYGVVYDLLTGRVIPFAKIKFDVEGSSNWTVWTDTSGVYQLDIFQSRAPVTVVIEAPDYPAGQMEDASPPYYERGDKARRERFEELTPLDLAPIPLNIATSPAAVALDFVLVPDRSKLLTSP